MLKGLSSALRHIGAKGFRLVRTDRAWAAVFTIEGPDGSAVRVLDVEGAYQSATYLGKRRYEPVFEYYRSFDAAFSCGFAVNRALMLGGGGCAWPKHAVATHPHLKVDVVEEDAGVIDIARRFFYAGKLEKPGTKAPDGSPCGQLKLIAAEGRAFVEQRGLLYDVILNDAFHGTQPALGLATVEAARAIKRRLRPCGVYLSNIVSADGGRDLSFLRDAAASAAEVFRNVQVIPCPDADYSDETNFLVAATDGETAFGGALPYDREFLGTPLRDRQMG